MLLSSLPSKLTIPFAYSGTKNTIPTASQIGITPGAASLTDGFPPLTATPLTAGGVPPSVGDMNGILYEVSAWANWSSAGGTVQYDSTFSTAVSGYPKNALLASTTVGQLWLNTVDGNTANPDSGGAGWVLIKPAYGVIGQVRNAKMSVTTAGTSATFTADEIVVGTSLGGLQTMLASYSQTISLATTGAGGMDTGSAPTSGYVALYAIYGSAGTSILAVNATSAAAPTVYGGSNLPTGYTYSALISVWPTNGSGQFVVGYQRDRSVILTNTSVLTGGTATTWTSVSLAGAVPLNAISIAGSGSTGGPVSLLIATNSAGTLNLRVFNATAAEQSNFDRYILATPQTIYYQVSSASYSAGINITGYDF